MSKDEGYETFRTISEMAAFLGISVRSAHRWADQGWFGTPSTVNGIRQWSPQQARKALERRTRMMNAR